MHKCVEAPVERWDHSKWSRARMLACVERSRGVGLTAADIADGTQLSLASVQWKLRLLLGLKEIEEVLGPSRDGPYRSEPRYVLAQMAGGSLRECRP